MEILTIVAEGLEHPIMLKDFLYKNGLSKTLVKRVKYGGITLDGQVVTVRAEVINGSRICIDLSGGRSENIPPMELPLRIVYEDECMLAVDKPRSMPTHPSKGNSLPTLANAVMGYFGGDFVFRAVNRLDRDTSGIVIIAKDQMTANTLAANMKRGDFAKSYKCTVEGKVIPCHGMIDAPIRREYEGSVKRIVAEDGKRALTEYTLESTDGLTTVCKIALHTGRTHQIRVHMAHIGHPLVGDFLYGRRDSGDFDLRCVSIELSHPITNERIKISVDN